MSRRQAREHIRRCCDDARVETADDRWETAALLLRDAADTARAQAGTAIDLQTLPPAANDARFSTSLERGLRILAMFNDHPIWRLADIADTLGLSRSTAHRYLASLVAMGQLERTGARLYRRAETAVGSDRPVELGHLAR
jgi:Fic family protein